MPSFVSRVNNFFSFRESFSRRPSVVFSRREERLCSPSLSKSTTFFHFLKLSFHREAKSFSSIARSGYAPPRTTSQPLFCILANFAAIHCVDPVTRETHFKQTPLTCQHKNHFHTNIQPNARSAPICSPPTTRHIYTLAFSPNDPPHHHSACRPFIMQTHSARSHQRQPKSVQANHTFAVIYIDVSTNISSLGEICLTSTTPLLIFRHTTK